MQIVHSKKSFLFKFALNSDSLEKEKHIYHIYFSQWWN